MFVKVLDITVWCFGSASILAIAIGIGIVIKRVCRG